MKGRSTLQQLLIILKDIYEHNTQTDVIYLDFSKAFDQVLQNKLLLKLWQIGITGIYGAGLNNRSPMCSSQWFVFNTTPSVIRHPSRKHSWPLLFLVYINDLFSSIHHSKALPYAVIYKFIFELMDSCKLQDDLNSLSDWSRETYHLMLRNLYTSP